MESYARWHKLRTIEAYRAIHQANEKRQHRSATTRARGERADASP